MNNVQYYMIKPVVKDNLDIQRKYPGRYPNVQTPESFRTKASEGEVVVFYFEPLATLDLKLSGIPEG